ncbi:MAG: rhodanese-like domain-containing protein [Methanothrix sp.]|uniref:rhodanese-like domain-containing protein n=1 Tax=Methanothrix sp. TaxID=90426 RepID=UPI0025E7A43F|nr:rhodanese-like domain-containing protein [Methanothrix sp.]MCQ8903258.1 rhodanese-like domain-containing protein [Methanothrix sp.]
MLLILLTSAASSMGVVDVGNISHSDVIMYVSNDNPRHYVQGAIHVPRAEFVADGRLRSVREICEILGSHGLTRNDTVVVYGSCMECGDPTYICWLLSYLGQEDVKVLEIGEIEANMSESPSIRPPANYTPELRPELLATYDYVKSGVAQIVDARSSDEFQAAHIPGAVNIESSSLLSNGRLKNASELGSLFNLDLGKPVVVYSLNGGQASLVWFALKILGYDARLYTWLDWLDNQPELGMELSDLRADVSPERMVRITARFSESMKNESMNVMGCVTCEPITVYTGGLSRDKSTGVRLGNYTSPGRKVVNVIGASETNTAGPVEAGSAADIVAVVTDSSDKEIKRIMMHPESAYVYTGTWDASGVPAGIYNLSVELSAWGITKRFDKRIPVEIQAERYRKLGRF